MNKINVMPRGPSSISTRHNIEIYNNQIRDIYEKTTSYSLKNRDKEYPLFSNDNSFTNRTKRWWNEEFIIIPQNIFEKANNSLTIFVFIFSLIVITYIYHNDLIFTNKTINDYSSLDDTKILSHIKENMKESEFIKLSKDEINKLIEDKKNNLLNTQKDKLYTYSGLKSTYTGFQIVGCIYLTLLTAHRLFNRTTV